MKHYRGVLGEFSFDPNMFELQDGNLIYVGGTHYGCIKCQIPEGILCCDRMFANNHHLSVGPVLPKSCISANEMCKGCTQLVVYPDINLALMQSNEFDCTTMFEGCTKLEQMSISNANARIDPWVCACEYSTDYSQHVQNMQALVAAENKRREKMYSIRHPFKDAMNQRNGVKNDVDLFSVDTAKHVVQFESFPELVHIINERKKGNYLGIIPKRSRGGRAEVLDVVEPAGSLTSCGVDSQSPEKMRV